MSAVKDKVRGFLRLDILAESWSYHRRPFWAIGRWYRMRKDENAVCWLLSRDIGLCEHCHDA